MSEAAQTRLLCRYARVQLVWLVATALLSVHLQVVAADTAAPIWTGRYPRITDIGKTSVEFTVQQNEHGVVHYMIVEYNASAPTVAEVLNGTGSGAAGQVAGEVAGQVAAALFQ